MRWALLVLAFAACGYGNYGDTLGDIKIRPFDEAAEGSSVLTVVNDHKVSLRIYLLRGGVKTYLGDVFTGATSRFALPPYFERYQLYVETHGQRYHGSHITEVLRDFNRMECIELRVKLNLDHSAVVPCW
jgi:hypothetical protein